MPLEAPRAQELGTWWAPSETLSVSGWGLSQLVYFLASTSAGSQVTQEGYLEAAPRLE